MDLVWEHGRWVVGWAAAAKDNPCYTLMLSAKRLCNPSFVTGPYSSSQSEKLEQSARRNDKWRDTEARLSRRLPGQARQIFGLR